MHARLALLRLLLEHERERLQTWARPLEPEKQRAGVPAGAWRAHARTAWDSDPVLALNLLDRCLLRYLTCYHQH